MGDSDSSEYKYLYPCYINSKKTLAEGRRLPKTQCVENPTLQEMDFVAKRLALDYRPEIRKRHPRDFWNIGRVRFRLPPSGLQVKVGSDVKDVRTRKDMFRLIAEWVPKARASIQAQINAAREAQEQA